MTGNIVTAATAATLEWSVERTAAILAIRIARSTVEGQLADRNWAAAPTMNPGQNIGGDLRY